MENIDESLYSRQLYVLGYEAMEKMLQSVVLIQGLDGLGQEVAKNVCLAGVKKMYIYDPRLVEARDLCTGFYFTEDCIGKRRDISVLNKLKELNPYVQVEISAFNEIKELKCAVLCNYDYDEQIRFNNYCRDKNVHFIGCQEKGLFSQIFCDFGDEFLVLDPNGEAPITGVINDIDTNGILTTIENEKHNLEDNDLIKITDNIMYEGKIFSIAVLSPHKLQLTSILDDELSTDITLNTEFKFTQGGFFEQQKKPKVLSFKKLADLIGNPTILDSNYHDPQRSLAIHQCFLTLCKLNYHNNIDNMNNKFISLYKEKYGEENKYNWLIEIFIKQVYGKLMPICSVVGGFVAQEILKAVSGKFHPLHQFLYFDSIDIICNNDNISINNVSNIDNTSNIGNTDNITNDITNDIGYNEISERYHPLIDIFGSNVTKIFKSNIFIVGAGAIGCEHLKNLTMLGCGKIGNLLITDMDSIEQSNLNRQFLFKSSDVSKMKAEVASKANLNPDVKVKYFNLKVGSETENIFNDSFFNNLDFVANALDNIESRLYIDDKCVFSRKALFDSGTLGAKGNAQTIIPFITESYASSHDPPEKNIPLCTIRNFPHLIEHTIEWALNEFTNLFHDNVTDYKLSTVEDCVRKAIFIFKVKFFKNINSLIKTFPIDHLSEEGIPFWTPPKRAPDSIDFNNKDPLHLLFVLSTTHLLAFCHNINSNNTDISNIINTIDTNDINIDSSSEDNNNEAANNETNSNTVKDTVKQIIFEKDNDTNHHINFIYSCANLRANNYKIQNASRHTVKGIAGRIIPAIATTTSLISGMSCLEMLKYIMNCPAESFKNCFVNLAIPFFATSTPIGPLKKEYYFTDKKYEFTLWDRIEIKDQTIKEVIEYFKNLHSTEITLIMIDSKIVYLKGDPKLSKNIDKLISSLTACELRVVVDVVFDTECEDFPPIVAILK